MSAYKRQNDLGTRVLVAATRYSEIEKMVEFDPAASKSDHEATLEAYLLEQDPTFGAILAPLLRFDTLERMSDADRRAIRAQVSDRVRKALDDGPTT